MIKINNFFFITLFLSVLPVLAYSWETKIILGCINENLEPCSSKVSQSKKIDVNLKNHTINPLKTNDINKVIKEKRTITEENLIGKKVKKNDNKPKIEKKVKLNYKNKMTKDSKEVKIKKKISLIETSNNSNKVTNFDNQMSFDQFKNFLINYTKGSDYPNIDN